MSATASGKPEGQLEVAASNLQHGLIERDLPALALGVRQVASVEAAHSRIASDLNLIRALLGGNPDGPDETGP